MKTLIVYDKNGNILFTLSPVENSASVNFIIADVPEDRQPIKVEDGEVVLDDSEEVKEKKQKMKELSEQLLELRKSLLDMEVDLC